MTYYPILPYQELLKMYTQRKINLPVPPYPIEKYFQPASVDLPIGSYYQLGEQHHIGEVYQLETTFLPSRINSVREFIQEHGIIEQRFMNGSEGFVFEPNNIYLLPLDIEIDLSDRQYAEFQTRSSAGRNDLFVSIIQDKNPEEWNKTTVGYQGKLWMLVIAQSFPIMIYPGDALAQMRIHEETYRSIFTENSIDPVHFTLHLDPDDRISLYRSRTSNDADPIEFRAKEQYRSLEYWIGIATDETRTVLLSPGHLYIGRSIETIAVPDRLALDLIGRNSRVGEMFIHYAGFIDPGFGMSGQTSIVFEIRVDRPTLVRDRQRIATANVIPLQSPTEKPYAGTYQLQALRLGKQFKP